jgi:hypothetical protein
MSKNNEPPKTLPADPDKVGYCKPPKHSQFQKGKSGNPKGRPKGSKDAASIMNEMFLKPLTIIQNGKPSKIPTIAVVLVRLLTLAIKGDHKAMKLALETYAKYIATKDSSSITDLMAGQSPFDLSAEEMVTITKHKLLEGVS